MSHITSIALSTLGATVVYFVLGGVFFGALPSMRSEFMKYPAVYRTQESMKGVMPIGMLGMLLSMFALSMIYWMMNHRFSPVFDGAHYGMLIGLFAVGSFVLHNHVNLNIGLKLTLQQAAAYFVQWVVVGITIAVIFAKTR